MRLKKSRPGRVRKSALFHPLEVHQDCPSLCRATYRGWSLQRRRESRQDDSASRLRSIEQSGHSDCSPTSSSPITTIRPLRRTLPRIARKSPNSCTRLTNSIKPGASILRSSATNRFSISTATISPPARAWNKSISPKRNITDRPTMRRAAACFGWSINPGSVRFIAFSAAAPRPRRSRRGRNSRNRSHHGQAQPDHHPANRLAGYHRA